MELESFTIDEVKNRVDYYSIYDDDKSAYLCFKELNEFLSTNKIKSVDEKAYDEYFTELIKLKFIALNHFFEWSDIANLVKNYYGYQFNIKYYDFWKKLKINLSAVSLLSERSKIKLDLKKALEECENVVISKAQYKIENIPLTVKGWITDYNSNLGIKDVSSIKRVEYLTNGKFAKELNDQDKNKIKMLFDLYEILKMPSNTPQGYEGDMPMTIDGKFYIYSESMPEEITEDVFNLIDSVKLSYKKEEKLSLGSRNQTEHSGKNVLLGLNKARTVSGPPLTQGEKEIKEMESVSQDYSEGTLEKQALSEEIDLAKRIEELRYMANKFNEGSLERKAIEEEIRRLS